MSKYDWSNVPSDVKWIATDADGVINGFDVKPECFEPHGWAAECFIARGLIMAENNPFKGDWKDSLEERPK